LGNCGMIAGAFSSTSGKADITLTTNGDVLYYNSGRQRLAIGTEGKVLTVSDADLPAWETGVSLSGNNVWTGTNNFNGATAGGKLEFLGKYLCTSPEISGSVSSLSVDLEDDYTEVIVIGGGTTTEAADLDVRVNTVSSNYSNQQILLDGTTVSGISATSLNGWEIGPAEIIDAAVTFQYELHITVKISQDDKFQCKGWANVTAKGLCITMGDATITSAGHTLTSVDIVLSAGTWIVDSWFNVYAVRKGA